MTSIPPAVRLDLTRPGTWLPAAHVQWARSLIFRTTLIMLGATALAAAVAFMLAGLLIHNDLFDRRLEDVQVQAERGIEAAQNRIDNAELATDAATLRQLMAVVREEDLRTQGGTGEIAYYRVDDAESAIAPPDFATQVLQEQGVVSPGLRDRVSATEQQHWYQSIAIRSTTSDELQPAIIVGAQLVVQNSGLYEVYFVYDLQDASQTLRFVQGTLWVAGGALVVIVAAIAFFVLRIVTRPVVAVAQTSERFASGDFDARLDVHGQDELASLSRSFNSMADSIESQITELAELSTVQQRFVSDVSHELRTPLTTIRLASSVVNDASGSFDANTARAAELLQTQVDRFDRLLGDLLEISRYDAGSAALEVEATNVAQLTEEIVDSMRDIAHQHGTELRFVAPGGHSPVDVDPRRIRRILTNLLGNAIEHSEARPVLTTVDSNTWAVAIGVRDYGVGMTDEEASHVFDRFWRADPSRKRTLGGTGLGLAIALGDAELHRGTLQVWSARGEGAHFVLTLPRGEQTTLSQSPIMLEPANDTLEELGVTQPLTTLPDAERAQEELR